MPLEVEISFESRALALLLNLYSYIFSKKKYFLDTPMKKLHNRTEAIKETSYMGDYNSSYFSFSLDWPVTKNQKLSFCRPYCVAIWLWEIKINCFTRLGYPKAKYIHEMFDPYTLA